MRSIFDEGTAGTVLIGMPGIKKRIAQFPQFYLRIGFVHEFGPLDANQAQELLDQRWTPAGVTLPDEKLIPEVVAKFQLKVVRNVSTKMTLTFFRASVSVRDLSTAR
jgi:hypothetical protein